MAEKCLKFSVHGKPAYVIRESFHEYVGIRRSYRKKQDRKQAAQRYTSYVVHGETEQDSKMGVLLILFQNLSLFQMRKLMTRSIEFVDGAVPDP